jgi:hypothetical protein
VYQPSAGFSDNRDVLHSLAMLQLISSHQLSTHTIFSLISSVCEIYSLAHVFAHYCGVWVVLFYPEHAVLDSQAGVRRNASLCLLILSVLLIACESNLFVLMWRNIVQFLFCTSTRICKPCTTTSSQSMHALLFSSVQSDWRFLCVRSCISEVSARV